LFLLINSKQNIKPIDAIHHTAFEKLLYSPKIKQNTARHITNISGIKDVSCNKISELIE